MSRFCAVASIHNDHCFTDGAAVSAALACPDGIASRIFGQGGTVGAVAAIRRGDDARDQIYQHDGLLVICGARIDRQGELRRALGAFAPDTEPPSAAEWIASAWRCWGVDCPQYLYGDYAFFVHDSVKGEVFAARDHIGAQPFFYAAVGDHFHCASDIAPLLAMPAISHEPDEMAVAKSQLDRSYDPVEETFFSAINRLPAGHCLSVSSGRLQVTRWWRPEHLPMQRSLGDAEAVATTRTLLERAIADRLVDARQPGFHLSGGIDSSLIAAIAVPMARGLGLKADHGYCWQQQDGSERPPEEHGWIEAIRSQLSMTLFAPPIAAESIAALLARDWFIHPDARFLLHEAQVQKAAAEDGVTTIFSGWGGDEGLSFNGRGHKPYLLATGQWRALWRLAEGPGLKAHLREFYGAAQKLVVGLMPAKSVRKYIAEGRSLIDVGFALSMQPKPHRWPREFGVQRTMLSLLREIGITNRIEAWAISGAEHGVEYVYPLLDRALLEHVLTLPPQMFARPGCKRWLVREVSRGIVPELIRTNISKDEPARVDQLAAAMTKAYAIIAEKLAAQAEPPRRAKYLDMDKVRQRLKMVGQKRKGLDRPLRVAIQLLDLT